MAYIYAFGVISDNLKLESFSQYGASPYKNEIKTRKSRNRKTSRETRNANLTRDQDNTFTLKAYAYESGEDEEEFGYGKRSQRKTHSGLFSQSLLYKFRSQQIEQRIDIFLVDHHHFAENRIFSLQVSQCSILLYSIIIA